jgi:DNA-binding phage protein
MALTRAFRTTVVKQVQEDIAFRAALVEEAARNIMEGDLPIALSQLRDVVNATMGFDSLSTTTTGIPKTSLMRMLSGNGNPRTGNLAAVLKAIGHNAGVRISVHAEPSRELAVAQRSRLTGTSRVGMFAVSNAAERARDYSAAKAC